MNLNDEGDIGNMWKRPRQKLTEANRKFDETKGCDLDVLDTVEQ